MLWRKGIGDREEGRLVQDWKIGKEKEKQTITSVVHF